MTAPGLTPIGIGFTPFETRADVVVEAALEAERLGFASVSVAEAMSLAAPVLLAQLALTTKRIELASSVLSVWGRTPATLAMTAAHLQQLSGGRFVLGLGASTSPLVEGFHGIRWERPIERLRETAMAVRALLAGERLPTVPDDARPLHLAVPPERPVPLGLAAITPPSIRLAGSLADRWLPFLLPAPVLDDARDLLAEGARQTGRADQATITASVPLAVAPDERTAAGLAARWLVTYCRSMGPVYPRVLRAAGYADEIDALLEANPDARSAVLPPAAERLARDVLLFATYDDAPAACRRWQAHTDAVSLVLPFGRPREELSAALHALAPALSP